MKKVISVLLCVLMTFSLVAISASAAEDALVVTVANDLHYDMTSATAETVRKNTKIDEIYYHATSGGQLHYESVAIIKAFLADAAKNESDIVVLPGDLTHKGSPEEHQAIIALLGEFEASTGKQVYVIPGNHDLFKISVAEFEELYADFGYGEAIANDPDSASYVVDLPHNYRLIAMDSCKAGDSPHGVDTARIDWIEAQCKIAKAAGKKVFAALHHNLLEHYILAATIHSTAIVTKNSMRLADVFADNGVKYVFTAHTHNHDITSYTSAAGNVVYDVVTTSLNAYPCAYRVVSFGKNVEIKTDYVRAIDTSLLPDGIHEEAIALAETNFLKYAKNCTYIGLSYSIRSYTTAASLKRLLNIKDEELSAIIDKAAVKIEKVLSMPIYAKDEAVENESIEYMAAALGITLPETEYYNLIDLATVIYQANAEGDENYPAHSDEMILFSRCLAVAINYAFSDVTNEEFAFLLSYVANLLGVDISDDIINALSGSIDKFRGSELFVTSVILPIVAEYGVDDAPADNNVTLPGYGENEPEESFLDKIKAFLKKIFDFFHMIFAMIA